MSDVDGARRQSVRIKHVELDSHRKLSLPVLLPRALSDSRQKRHVIRRNQATVAVVCLQRQKRWRKIRISRPHFLGLLAEALLKNDEIDEGLRVLSDALVLVTETGQRYYESELQRLRGELFARRGHTNEAEQAFRRSIAVARMQNAKSFELRAIASLEQLASAGGKA